MPDQSTQNWGLHGHVAQLKLLERAMANGQLAHAYIFTGPAQVGKRSAARRLAQFLLCEAGTACGACANCRSFDAASHADYIEISSAGEPIKIEAVRDLGYKLALRPYAGRKKVAVIDDAHLMTPEAANALLKVLEEPKPDTHLILVTDNYHRLLPTISSRAQKVSFGHVDERSFNDWLQASGLPQPDPVYAGRPGYVKAQSAADSGPGHDVEAFEGFLSGSLGTRLLLAQQLAEKETPELKAMLEHWLHHLRHKLVREPSPPLARKIHGVIRAQRMLEQNANSKLLLSDLMVQT